MTDKECANDNRECPITSEWVQEHGVMKSQIAEIYRVNTTSVMLKWIAIMMTIGVVSFGVGREISMESKNDAKVEHTVLTASLLKLNDKLDLNMKEINLKIDINSNRLTALEHENREP